MANAITTIEVYSDLCKFDNANKVIRLEHEVLPKQHSAVQYNCVEHVVVESSKTGNRILFSHRQYMMEHDAVVFFADKDSVLNGWQLRIVRGY